MQSSKGYQVMSQPTSPNKDSIIMETSNQTEVVNNRIGYAASLVEPSMQMHFIDSTQIQSMTQAQGNISAMSSSNGQYKK